MHLSSRARPASLTCFRSTPGHHPFRACIPHPGHFRAIKTTPIGVTVGRGPCICNHREEFPAPRGDSLLRPRHDHSRERSPTGQPGQARRGQAPHRQPRQALLAAADPGQQLAAGHEPPEHRDPSVPRVSNCGTGSGAGGWLNIDVDVWVDLPTGGEHRRTEDQLRFRTLANGSGADRRALRALDAQISALLASCGFEPVSRGRYNLAPSRPPPMTSRCCAPAATGPTPPTPDGAA